MDSVIDKSFDALCFHGGVLLQSLEATRQRGQKRTFPEGQLGFGPVSLLLQDQDQDQHSVKTLIREVHPHHPAR